MEPTLYEFLQNPFADSCVNTKPSQFICKSMHTLCVCPETPPSYGGLVSDFHMIMYCIHFRNRFLLLLAHLHVVDDVAKGGGHLDIYGLPCAISHCRILRILHAHPATWDKQDSVWCRGHLHHPSAAVYHLRQLLLREAGEVLLQVRVDRFSTAAKINSMEERSDRKSVV